MEREKQGRMVGGKQGNLKRREAGEDEEKGSRGG